MPSATFLQKNVRKGAKKGLIELLYALVDGGNFQPTEVVS